jgi:hypothetical protein
LTRWLVKITPFRCVFFFFPLLLLPFFILFLN